MSKTSPATITADAFIQHFGAAPTHSASARGRVNLIGDHTDYNGGLVMPCQLNHATEIHLRRRDDMMISGLSDQFGSAQRPRANMDEPSSDDSWLNFVTGALHMLGEINPSQVNSCGLDVMVSSTVPAGAGVSSSAALEIALLRGMSDLFGLGPIDPVEMAKMAQRIEHEFTGTKCGIMDQMVSAAVGPGRAMMLDCENLSFSLEPLFTDASFVVMHSGSSRKLSEALYNTRFDECMRVAGLLDVETLRGADMTMVQSIVEPVLKARARHVLGESDRVRAAALCLQDGDTAGFGQLMSASHASLRDDYEVSSKALDQLVDAFMACGALGARLTGAGFGGCVVALCRNDGLAAIEQQIKSICPPAYLVDVIGLVGAD